MGRFSETTLHPLNRVHARRSAIDVPEAQASIGDSRVLYDWYEPNRVRRDYRVEQRVAPVTQLLEINISLNIGGLRLQMPKYAYDLNVGCGSVGVGAHGVRPCAGRG